MLRVLAMDGGGVRALIPALVLAEVEERVGRPVAEVFDLLVGASSGGLLALALVTPGSGGQPAYPAGELAGIIAAESPRIFSRPLFHRLRALGNLLEERYPADGLEQVLAHYLGEARLSDALTEVMVPSYDIERRRPVLFKSHRARREPGRDLPLRVVARAATAAPTYFEPARLADGRALVDGGLFLNNPALSGLVEARESPHFPGEDVLVVSLGAGEEDEPIPHRRARGWGVLGWASELLGVAFDGISDTVDYQLGHLLRPRDGEPRYLRFQIPLGEASGAIDDASPENLSRLRRRARELIRDNDAALDLLARLIG